MKKIINMEAEVDISQETIDRAHDVVPKNPKN